MRNTAQNAYRSSLKIAGRLLLVLGIGLILVQSETGCRSKSTQTITDIPVAGGWIVRARTYRTPPLPRHVNDTLLVRVYNDTTTHHVGGMQVRFKAVSGSAVSSISPVATTVSDTITKPWGTSVPVIYNVRVDTMIAETVDCWLVQDDGADTLAHYRFGFKLQ